MLISLFTDASVYSHFKAGGWGIWIKSQRGRLSSGGPLKEPVTNSNVAETLAIANGIAFGVKKKMILAGDIVLIQSDSKNAISFYEGTKHKVPDQAKKAVDHAKKLARDHGFTMKFRHVRGHVENGDKRHYVNNVCDSLAKQGAQKAIARRKGHTQEKASSHLESHSEVA